MSNRTLVELNHDYCPGEGKMVDEATMLLIWAQAMQRYMRSGNPSDLPRGVTFKHMRHHTDPDPLASHGDPS